MGLSEDQKAMLRLLAQREDGYEDIAALLGIGVEDVRARVRDALGELDAADTEIAAAAEAKLAEAPAAPPRPAEPAPYPAPDPRPSADADAPRPDPAAPTEAPRSAPPPPAAGSGGIAAWIAGNRRRLELAGGALVAILIVLFATGVVDLGGSDSGSDQDRPAGAGGGREPTQAVLASVGGGEAEGRAAFSRLRNQAVLTIEASGLDPSPKGRSYAVSLVRARGDRIPVAAVRANRQGKLEALVPVPTNVLGLIAGGYDEIEVTSVRDAALRRALRQANRKPPRFSGEDVLRGPITGPIVNQQAE